MSDIKQFHTSVLLAEVQAYLAVKPEKKYIDATLGGGGHTSALLANGGRVLGIDQDQEAIDYVTEKYKEQRETGALLTVKGNFSDIERLAKEYGFDKVNGIVFDLGVSSYQFDTPERGFSFQKNGPLDMRMDTGLSVSARDLINGLTKQELSDLFYRLGEEYRSRVIAQAIVKEREKEPIETTERLEKVIRHAVGGRFSAVGKFPAVHPATKVFQALRIAINDELHNFEQALPQALDILESKGRIVVISFHSLEDRISKRTFKDWESQGKGMIITEKPVVPSEEEKTQNPRSRSAKLRVFEKL